RIWIWSLIWGCLLILNPCTEAWASNFGDTYGFSVQGIGMGNAVTAIVDDWSAVYYNIAGLGRTRHRKPDIAGRPPRLNDLAVTLLMTRPNFNIDIQRQGIVGDKNLDFGAFVLGVAFDLNQIYTMPAIVSSARLGVGLQGFGFASASYINAVNYARQRVQGTDLTKIFDKDPQPVAIINHPDVRRQLVHMKAYVDGMRALMYYTALCFDKVLTAADDTEKDMHQGLIELLIPVVKGYITDRAFEVCTQGVQVYGGYGFIREYPQEQLLRDCKITSIYEGTNGIQAMDLLGRKLGLKKGKPFMDLLTQMNQTIAAAKEIPGLEEMAIWLEKAVNKLGETAMHMGMTAMSEKALDAFAVAQPFLDVTGDVVMGWLELWRAVVAQPKIDTARKKDAAFYLGQVKTAQYFIQWVLPATLGKMDALQGNIPAIMEMPDAAFAG
ncbi:MAG: acyl-CoA dehydrogenase C-terminal domain-containing protein, partial [Desulfotignum sp.]